MKKILIAFSILLIVLACSPEETGVQVDTAGGKLDKIVNIPEMTRQDYNVMNFLGSAKSIRDLEPQLFAKSRWELITEAEGKYRDIINAKDGDEIISILSYQVIITDSNMGVVTAINPDGLRDDRIGKIVVNRMYVTEDRLHGIRVFVIVNHPGKAVMSYINCREVALKESTVEIVHENIAQEVATNKHRRWITEKAEGKKVTSPQPAWPPKKLTNEQLLELPPVMRPGR